MSFMAAVPTNDTSDYGRDDRHHFTVEDVTRIILNDMVDHLPDQNHQRVTHRCQRVAVGGECARCPNCPSLRLVR